MLKKITILSICFAMLLLAVDPNYYIRRANLNFKQVNDNHGHIAGDMVLVELCKEINKMTL